MPSLRTSGGDRRAVIQRQRASHVELAVDDGVQVSDQHRFHDLQSRPVVAAGEDGGVGHRQLACQRLRPPLDWALGGIVVGIRMTAIHMHLQMSSAHLK